MNMSLLEIIELAFLILAVLVLVIYTIIGAVKNKWVSKLYDTVMLAIKEAEKTGKSGKDKKAYVMSKVEEKCTELGIPYTLLYKLISKLIDTVISHYNVVSK